LPFPVCCGEGRGQRGGVLFEEGKDSGGSDNTRKENEEGAEIGRLVDGARRISQEPKDLAEFALVPGRETHRVERLKAGELDDDGLVVGEAIKGMFSMIAASSAVSNATKRQRVARSL